MKLPLKNPFLLAPMEEVNDIAFRLICKEAGAGMTWTGMIHPQTHQKIDLDDKPVLQLFCTTTKGIPEFMKKYDDKVSGWDFNLGCPAKTARKHGFGSFLISDLKTIEEIIKTMRENTKKPLFVKIRKSKNAFKLLKIAEQYCDAIVLHSRTREQGYGGNADLKYAIKFKKKSKIPMIYSGDVNEKNYKDYLKHFDYLMIGRRAIGSPEIFSIFNNTPVKKIEFKDYLKLAEKHKISWKIIKFQAMNFTKSKHNAKELRLEIFKIKNKRELKKLFN